MIRRGAEGGLEEKSRGGESAEYAHASADTGCITACDVYIMIFLFDIALYSSTAECQTHPNQNTLPGLPCDLTVEEIAKSALDACSIQYFHSRDSLYRAKTPGEAACNTSTPTIIFTTIIKRTKRGHGSILCISVSLTNITFFKLTMLSSHAIFQRK